LLSCCWPCVEDRKRDRANSNSNYVESVVSPLTEANLSKHNDIYKTALFVKRLRDSSNPPVTNLSSIENLDLSYTDVSDSELEILPDGCPLLKILILLECPVRKIDVLANCKNLNSLELCSTSVSNTSLSVVVKALPLLESLSLCGNKHLTDKWIQSLEYCSLKELDLMGTGVTDLGVAHLATRFLNLECLSLAFTGVTDKGVTSLQECQKLHTLFLWNTNITGSCFKELVHLRSIDVSCCEFLSDEGRRALEDCNKLVSLLGV
jgi:hypothetical protein